MEQKPIVVLGHHFVVLFETWWSRLRNEKHAKSKFKAQWKRFSKAFVYFMTEDIPEDFVDIKIDNRTAKLKPPKGKKVRKKSRVFSFKREAKKGLLFAVVQVENIVKFLERLMFKKSVDFENRYRE